MRRKELLYATYREEGINEGLSYATYMARIFGKKLRIMVFERQGFTQRVENLLTGITFAEADEHNEALKFSQLPDTQGLSLEEYFSEAREFCAKEGVSATLHAGFIDTFRAIMDVHARRNIDMIILSPEISKSGDTPLKLPQASSRPVVTLAR